MSESVEKALRYLGESKKKAGVVVVAADSKRKSATTSENDPAPAKSGRRSVRELISPSGDKRYVRRDDSGRIRDADDVGVEFKSVRIEGHMRMRAPKLPSNVVSTLAKRLFVTPETVLHVSDISARTYHRRQANQEPLTEAESDRVLRIARVASEAERVFGNAAKASRWLSTDSRILGAKPLDLLATDAGSRDVEFELVRIDHGDFA